MFKSFRLRLFVIFLLTTIGISGIAIYFVQRIGLEGQTEGLRKTVVGIATTTALMIDPELHKKVDPNSLVINELTSSLDFKLYKIAKSNPDIVYVYTLVETDDPNICKFTLGSDDYGKKVLDPDEINYDVSKIPEIRDKTAFSKPLATKNFYSDKWGVWLSGYAPIKDKDEKTIAIVGIDMSAKKVAQFQEGIKIWSLLVFILDVLISVILSLIISSTISLPLMKITEHTRIIAEGNFKSRINVKARDEIKILADSFNDMIEKLDYLFLEVNEAHADLKDAYLDTIYRLAVAAEYKDKVTAQHLRRVSAYACIIAKHTGLSTEDIESIKFGSPLHDIGKIGIPDSILLKKDKLTNEEYTLIKEHTTIGYKILKESQSPYLKTAAIISLTHHEKFDGTGYPKGLRGEEIHIYGRVVALADVFDALTSERPYKKPLSMEDTLNIIKDGSGTQFDPKIVEAFFNGLEEIKKYIKFVEWTSV